jgi:hypothetical protein
VRHRPSGRLVARRNSIQAPAAELTHAVSSTKAPIYFAGNGGASAGAPALAARCEKRDVPAKKSKVWKRVGQRLCRDTVARVVAANGLKEKNGQTEPCQYASIGSVGNSVLFGGSVPE